MYQWLGLGLGLIGLGLIVGAMFWRMGLLSNLVMVKPGVGRESSTSIPPAAGPEPRSALATPSQILIQSPTAVSLLPASTVTQAPASTKASVSHAGWIAYTYGFEAEKEIFLYQPDTREMRQVTSNNFQDESPSFSPDGNRLAYSSYRLPGGWDIYVYDFLSQTEIQITDFTGQARFPAWSPVTGDERILFVGRQGEPDFQLSSIWVVQADGRGLTQLTSENADYIPAWAPDGLQIVFGRGLRDDTGDGRVTTSDNLDLFILDLAVGEPENITNTPYYDDFYAHWSPDGQWIVSCSVRRDANGDLARNLDDSRGLYLVHPDGSGEKFLGLGDQLTFDPNWSPDGQWILYGVKIENGIFELWVYNPFTQQARRLTDAGPYSQPDWGK